MKKLSAAAIAIGIALGFVATYSGSPMAARNSGGTYSLPSSVNPVVSGTTITSTWSNTTLNDVASEITNSLDRNGRGAMAAPLQLTSGGSSNPSLTFASETSSGIYRAASNDIRMQVGSNNIEKWTATGATITGALVVSSGITNTGSVVNTADVVVDSAGANVGSYTAKALRFGSTSSGEAITSARVTGASLYGLDLWAGAVNRMSLTNTGGIVIPGSYATTPGTAITGSYGATYSINFGVLTPSTNYLSAQTLTGVSVGGVCDVSTDGNIGNNALSCYVSAANTVQIKVICISGNTLGTGNYRVRVWQP